jgi:hypothetical protein
MRMFSAVGPTTDGLVPMNSMKEMQAVTPRSVEHQLVRFQAAEETTVDFIVIKLVRQIALIWADACSKSNFNPLTPNDF